MALCTRALMLNQIRVEISQKQLYSEWEKVMAVAVGAMPEH